METQPGSAPVPGGDKEGIRRIAEGAGFTAVGAVAARALEYAGKVVMTQVLGAASFGALAFAVVVLDIAALVSRLGLDFSVLFHVSRFAAGGSFAGVRPLVRRCASSVALSGIAVAAFLVLGGGSLRSGWLLANPEIRALLAGLLPAVPVIGVLIVYARGLQGLGSVREFNWVYRVLPPLFRLALLLVLVVPAVALGLDSRVRMAAVVAAFAGSYAFSAARAFTLFENRCPRAAGPSAGVPLRQILFFAFPMFFDLLFGFILLWTDTVMLLWLRGSTIEVGIYNAAAMWGLAPMAGIICLNEVFGPTIARLHAAGQMEELRRQFRAVSRWSAVFGLGSFAFAGVLTPELLRLNGREFPPGSMALVLLAFGSFANAATGPVGTVILMTGRPWINLANGIGVGLLNVGLNFWLIPLHGMEGAAAATAASSVSINLLRAAEVWWLTGILPLGLSCAKPFGAVGLAAAILWGARAAFPGGAYYLWVAGGAVLFSAVFFLAMRVLGPEEEDRELFGSIRRRLRPGGDRTGPCGAAL